MPHVQTKPQPRVVHARRNGHQRVRRRLHDVFQRQDEVRRHLLQKVPPEQDGLLHIPLREVDVGDEAAVEHHLPDAQLLSRRQRLAEAVLRRLPHQRVDGAGDQLGKGRVEPQSGKTGDPVGRLRQRGGVIQHGCVGEGDVLAAQPPAPRQRRGAVVHAGDIQLFLKGIDHERAPFVVLRRIIPRAEKKEKPCGAVSRGQSLQTP